MALPSKNGVGFIIFACKDCNEHFHIDNDDPRQLSPRCPKCGSNNLDIKHIVP